ncbi:hypothetical protein [Billgrantia gudaonensis]|uniref:Uncharacterized protein n=1 Tax=Billgrantia gudaonensis TaxID=376427 RepID=A0A1G8N777_9GAMM|nr:hypothetical protein [Halomonas gudaonensis]SDI75955.1 hypothetical protein SAMN04487954_101243 [Halomonas gudaonensis]
MTRSQGATLPIRRWTLPMAGGRRWWPTLLVVVLLMMLLDVGQRWLASQSEAPLYRVIVAGESLTLDEQAHDDFSRDLAGLAGDSRKRLAARMRPWLAGRLAAAFAPLEAAVPGYLDWYFSPVGSYSRLGVALFGDLDAWLDDQLHARLIEPSGIEAALAELQAAHSRRLVGEQQRLIGEMASQLHDRYASRQVEASERDDALPILDIDLVLHGLMLDGRDRSRWSVAVVGGGRAGLLAGRALAARLGSTAAGQGSRLALRALASRLGTGAARAMLGGSAVAAFTAPSGPGALVAGSVTTAATLAGIAGSEFAMLEAQEALQRPAMQAQLLDEIDRSRAAMAVTLEVATADAAQAMEERLSRSLLEEAKQAPAVYRIVDRLSEPER